jgi:Domain of unknown function (DUF4403)
MRMHAPSRIKIVAAAAALMVVSACGEPTKLGEMAPPRASDPIVFPKEPSRIAVDLDVDLAALEAALEREVPRELWRIDRPGSECMASRKVDLAIVSVKSPKIKCRIVGKVTRGPLRLSGSGEMLVVNLPVNGAIAARDVAGVLKGKTATGTAEVALKLRLDLTRDWRVAGTTKLDYRWTKEPGIDFMGQRINLTETADRHMQCSS